MIIKNAEIFTENGKFQRGDILIEQERITFLNLTGISLSESGMDEELDALDYYAIPGLVDIHLHGCAGYDFCDGTKEAFDAITAYEAAHGITAICPATMTLPEEQLAVICKNVSTYQNNEGAILSGLHMEGPYLSVQKKGAQNEAYLQKPDIAMFHRLNELSGNRFKLVSLAPEVDGAMEFIREIKNEAVISLAHTTADYELSLEAFRHGASHITHLYNAMLPFNHREPGLIGAAFDTQNCMVELICDGIHIHPSVVRATLQMFGEDRVIFISDSMMAAGLPDGTYGLGGQEVTVTGKKAYLMDGTLAGSVSNLMDCMKNAVLNMKLPLETAVKAASVNPAKSIGVFEDYGSITPGKFANIVLLDKQLNIKAVIIKGSIYLLSND